VQIVEFPSYEDAMANLNLPESSNFAAQLAALCNGPPTFRTSTYSAKSRCRTDDDSMRNVLLPFCSRVR
jgi:hypothetical protein